MEMREHRVHELRTEQRNFPVLNNREQRQENMGGASETMNYNEQISNIRKPRSLEREGWSEKQLLKKPPNVVRNINLQIQKDEPNPSQIIPRTFTSGHATMTLRETNDKEKSCKQPERNGVSPTGEH